MTSPFDLRSMLRTHIAKDCACVFSALGEEATPCEKHGHCPTCRNSDGSLNLDELCRELVGVCCSMPIPWDEGGGFCPVCHDHSANRYECEDCGAIYEDWDNGTWARMEK